MDKKFFDHKKYNKVLFETENFVVLPSLGSLIEGWLLVVPKKHVINLSLLEKIQYVELENIVSNLEYCLGSFYGNCVLFEHGPRYLGSKAGCGVDYAHLHILPTKFDLMIGINKFLNIEYNWLELSKLSEIASFKNRSKDYLYYRNQNGKHFITLSSQIPSQLFRQVLAYYLNTPEKYDWKLYPENEKVQGTINKLSDIAVSNEYY
jgi:diadenosine tetraphosphate (Ap4A) HIT family hydrolase